MNIYEYMNIYLFMKFVSILYGGIILKVLKMC